MSIKSLANFLGNMGIYEGGKKDEMKNQPPRMLVELQLKSSTPVSSSKMLPRSLADLDWTIANCGRRQTHFQNYAASLS